ncbi:cation:proton antiporter [Pseudofrancisella aestuarii]|uniref:Cation:proton antiporter n=1 Tax=Pseudofrancisella aestuarii TaxID=2670347 RepID=A0ABV9TCH8_9GAMM|nr:sodium:proton antiporter [Pseudofrancisella aestuarii]
MNIFFLFSLLIIVTALLSYVNTNFLKFPKAIGLTMLSIVFSIGCIIIFDEGDFIVIAIKQFDFRTTLLNGMISFMLFASALCFNAVDLKKETKAVVALSVSGVIISTLITAILAYYTLTLILNIGSVPFGNCLVFGALISPTDPIAVISTLSKNKNVPKPVKVQIVGEALFNDATSIVLFVVLTNIVFFDPTENLDPNILKDIPYIILIIKQITIEAVGGILLGCLFAIVTLFFIRTNKDDETTILITLAVSSMGYIAASKLGVSAPITMVIAGLITGKKLSEWNKKKQIKIDLLSKFWRLIDNILNSFLFIMIGLELTEIDFTTLTIIIGFLVFVIMNFSRFISVFIPMAIINRDFSKSAFKNKTLMTWAGIRGGVSLALVLSISHDAPHMVAVTYVAVVLSILIQGSTLGALLNKLYPPKIK